MDTAAADDVEALGTE